MTETDPKARLKQMLASGELRLEPLTLPQRELWEASRLAPELPATHISAFLRVRGSIAPQQAEKAIARVVERQEVLRLGFLPGKEGRPLQAIRATPQPTAFAHHKFSGNQAEWAQVEEHMRDFFLRPFDLRTGPLYRVEMLELGPGEIVLPLSIHHSIADGWSLGVFVQDLVSAYLMDLRGVKGQLPPVAQTCAQWAAAERAYWTSTELNQRLDFWKHRLAGAGRLWAPPAPDTAPLERWITHIPVELAAGVRALAKGAGATLYSTLLAAFQRTLAQFTGKDDVTVGTPVANRNKAAVKESMGYFSGVVPIRGQVDPRAGFRQHLRQTHQEVIDAFANAMPFAELAAALGEKPSPTHNPVYDVRFALQNHPIPEIALTTISAKLHMRSTGTARFDLACEITEEGEAMELVWLYRTSLFKRSQMEELRTAYLAELERACRE